MAFLDIFRRKKEKELFPTGIPESISEKEMQETSQAPEAMQTKPEIGFQETTPSRPLEMGITAREEIKPSLPLHEATDKTELILARLETIKAMLDNIDQRLRKIEKIAEESQESYWK